MTKHTTTQETTTETPKLTIVTGGQTQETTTPEETPTLFATEEDRARFRVQFPMQMLQLWATNNAISRIYVHPALEAELRAELETLGAPPGGEGVSEVIASGLEDIEIVPDPMAQPLSLVTLAEQFQLPMAAHLKAWAAKRGLNKFLEEHDIPFHPTMDMLAICYMLMELMPAAQMHQAQGIQAVRGGIDTSALRTN